ncbi:hypothetical protein FRC01_014114, partial [Tulasnella sp. 417]
AYKPAHWPLSNALPWGKKVLKDVVSGWVREWTAARSCRAPASLETSRTQARTLPAPPLPSKPLGSFRSAETRSKRQELAPTPTVTTVEDQIDADSAKILAFEARVDKFPVSNVARSKKISDSLIRRKNINVLEIKFSRKEASKMQQQQQRQPQTGGSITASTAKAGPASASSSATGTLHPCIETDMYQIVNRHAASPETVQKRRAILATLQEATSSITAWKVIDVSPWTYSFETEESVLQVALAQPYDPLSSGETAAAPERRQKKGNSRKSPNLRPLESVLQGISPFLQIPTDSESKLPEPVECTIEGVEFDLYPPSPLHAAQNAFFNAYRWHYQPLHALLPFFDLWLRSWDVEPGELSPACLAHLVFTYLGHEYGMRDLLSWMEHNPTRRNVAHHASDFLEAAER